MSRKTLDPARWSGRFGIASRPLKRSAVVALLAGLLGAAGCQVGSRPYRPDFVEQLVLVGGDFWETTLVDVSVPYDPSRPVRIGDLATAGSVRVTGLRPLAASVVDGLAAGVDGADLPVVPVPGLEPAANGVPAVARMSITARVRVSARTMDEASRRVRNATVALVNEYDAQVVRLIAPGAAGYLDRVNYDITFDHPAPLTVRTREGDVSIARMAGDLDVLSGSGSIDVVQHGPLADRPTRVRAIARDGDVSVDAASDRTVASAERGRVVLDWSLGPQPLLLEVVSLEPPRLPVTTRYTANVRVSIRDEDIARQWRDGIREAWVNAESDAAGG